MRILPIVSGTRLPVGVRPVGRSLVKQKSCVKNFDTAFLLYKALKFKAKDGLNSKKVWANKSLIIV